MWIVSLDSLTTQTRLVETALNDRQIYWQRWSFDRAIAAIPSKILLALPENNDRTSPIIGGLYLGPLSTKRYVVLLNRSRENSKPRDMTYELSDFSKIWQWSWQHCCRETCRTVNRYVHLNTRSLLRYMWWDVLLLGEQRALNLVTRISCI